MRYDEPRLVWTSLTTTHWCGTSEEPGTLTQGGALFSLIPLIWESNPKSRVAGASPTTSPIRVDIVEPAVLSTLVTCPRRF
jgi:hypothetical protein